MTYLPPLDPFVLLENSRDPDGTGVLFERPSQIVRCAQPQEIDAAFDAIEQGLAEGLHAAGWVSYDVGYWLESKLRGLMPEDVAEPLLWIGLFPERRHLDRRELEAFWAERTAGRGFTFSPPALSLDRPAYLRKIAKVHDYLAAGDIYQANFTMDATGQVGGDPLALHAALRLAQPVRYGAFIATGDWCISSHSPELFFSLEGRDLTVQPMKGTAPRGRSDAEDLAAIDALRNDPKSRAENLMIVDLERNDLSRLAEPGSVDTRALFEVEALPTALQMTSTVTARLKAPAGPRTLFGALFPCGSVTGAPKIRAMQIIDELEARPRGVYTGAIGQIGPGGDARFSVPIRTLAIDGRGRYRFGLGSGVVADSDADLEYEECLLKGAFLEASGVRPALIETILYEPGKGYWLLDGHLERLAGSARYFGYPVDIAAVTAVLDEHALSVSASRAHRIRLLLGPAGDVSVTSRPFEPASASAPLTVAWAAHPVHSGDVFLFHKTTNRSVYDRAMAAAATNGHWDLLFVNERGELTEGARSTLFVERDGVLVTPPESAGLLCGVLRKHLLADPDRKVIEGTLKKDDVRLKQCIYVGNALNGLMKVQLVDQDVEF